MKLRFSSALRWVPAAAAIGLLAPDVSAQEVTNPSGSVDALPVVPEETAAETAAPLSAEKSQKPPETAAASGPGDDKLAALQAQIDELKAKQEEAETNALLGNDTAAEVKQEVFKVYGFMDMGAQRYWANPKALVGAVFDTNAATFVTGNVDLYFDFNPAPDWRGLAEVRFTSAPLGNIETYGGLGGSFKRTNTEQFDPNGTAPNAPMWGSYVVLERAYIEWNHFQSFRLLVGNFPTPFGIWNVDHGSPTLISIAMPQMIQQKWIPLRQTGVQAVGSFFADDVEVAYRAWISNGRTEQNPFDYDDGKSAGLRLLARRDGGDVNFQVGASYHFGHVRDKVVNITGFNPVTFETPSTWEYDEHVLGGDLSLDLGNTRIRTEAMFRHTQWTEGKQAAIGELSPGSKEPNKWQSGAYMIVAQALPWFGLEPYLYGEVMQQPWQVADGLATLSGGINVRFTPSTMLKTQVTRALFFNWKYHTPGEPEVNNITTAIARLVMAF